MKVYVPKAPQATLSPVIDSLHRWSGLPQRVSRGAVVQHYMENSDQDVNYNSHLKHNFLLKMLVSPPRLDKMSSAVIPKELLLKLNFYQKQQPESESESEMENTYWILPTNHNVQQSDQKNNLGNGFYLSLASSLIDAEKTQKKIKHVYPMVSIYKNNKSGDILRNRNVLNKKNNFEMKTFNTSIIVRYHLDQILICLKQLSFLFVNFKSFDEINLTQLSENHIILKIPTGFEQDINQLLDNNTHVGITLSPSKNLAPSFQSTGPSKPLVVDMVEILNGVSQLYSTNSSQGFSKLKTHNYETLSQIKKELATLVTSNKKDEDISNLKSTCIIIHQNSKTKSNLPTFLTNLYRLSSFLQS
ncbi:uncharacterized protein ASCRUDRAFT_131089 [Ascoidea rubescens DSM 1968]|uniref:Required for respiratory growth protein 8, mitochondrial n=1 Tax=Ascoidea rubescens DSM 1968 TaxID=1344418 RepID=A0A1D2V8H3_9ASCO|nr:hypothetical protein ASCRUDRAFT_131089 [Ascoidea rubescens DSM 1968]ODV57914.1 hypothetical protein ASCRUDRAFT_131089 [Ascoidea rubescens DSM 1968]